MIKYALLGLGTATTPASEIQTALTNGFTSIASDMTTTVSNIVPIVLGVVGLVLVVGFGIRFFRKNASPTK